MIIKNDNRSTTIPTVDLCLYRRRLLDLRLDLHWISSTSVVTIVNHRDQSVVVYIQQHHQIDDILRRYFFTNWISTWGWRKHRRRFVSPVVSHRHARTDGRSMCSFWYRLLSKVRSFSSGQYIRLRLFLDVDSPHDLIIICFTTTRYQLMVIHFLWHLHWRCEHNIDRLSIACRCRHGSLHMSSPVVSHSEETECQWLKHMKSRPLSHFFAS